MLGTVRFTGVRALLLYCEQKGVAQSAILQAAGVEAALVADQDAILPLDKIIALWMHAYAMTGDPWLSLHVGEWAPHAHRTIMYFLFVNARSVGEAFAKLVTHSRSLANTTNVRLLEEPSRVGISFENVPGFVASRQEREWMLALTYCGVRTATGVPFRPLLVEFAAPAPDDIREHERVFGCPVHFGRSGTRIWVRRWDWDLPNQHANADLLRILEAHAQHMAQALPPLDTTAAAVRALVTLHLDSGHPSIEQIAKQLALSPRTLQRRLAAEKLSFSDLVEQAREATSQRLLKEHNLSLAEVALLVGFSEQSAFTRAFKKWTGTTPAEFRRRETHALS